MSRLGGIRGDLTQVLRGLLCILTSLYEREEHNPFNMNPASDNQDPCPMCSEMACDPAAKALKRQWGIRHPGKGGALDF